MSDEPTRLLESVDPRVAATLRSALRDEPSNESVARAARALGVGGAAMSTVIAATTAARAAIHAKQGVSVGVAIGKWLAIGAVVGGAAGSTWVLQNSPAEAPVRHARSQMVTAQPHPKRIASTSTASTSAAPTSAVAPEVTVVPSKDATRVLTQRVPSSAVSSSSASSERKANGAANADQSALAADLDLLSRARSALKNGNASTALAILSRRERDLPVRTLDAEATLLRVQALVAAGRSEEARAVARAALSGSSKSAYACRLASIAAVDAPSCSGKR